MNRNFIGRVITRTCAEGDHLCNAVIQADPSGEGEDAQSLIRHFTNQRYDYMSNNKTKPSSTRNSRPKSSGRNVSKGKTGSNRNTSGKGRNNQFNRTEGDVSIDNISNPSKDYDISANNVFSSAAEVSLDANVNISSSFPQTLGLALYSVNFTPCGSAGTIAESEFQAVQARRMLQDVRKSLKYNPGSAITKSHLQSYFNTVASAVMTYYSVAHQMRVCYLNSRRTDLRARYELVYDESIAPVHNKLGKALFSFYLPTKVKELALFLSRVYLSDEGQASTYLQILPYADEIDSAADMVTVLNASLTALNGITNADSINTAFSSEIYQRVASIEVKQSNVPLVDTRDSYFFDIGEAPVYSDQFLNIWANLPLEAGDGAVTRRFEIADETATINRVVYGNSFSIANNTLPPKYLTSGSKYEPGFIAPATANPTLATANNFGFINTNGTQLTANITTFSMYVYGPLSRNAENIYDVTKNITTPVIPAGAYYVKTNFSRMRNDVAKLMDFLFEGGLKITS